MKQDHFFLYIYIYIYINKIIRELLISRSSRPEVFCKKVVQNSQENTCDRVSFLITLQAGAFEVFLLKKRPWRRCFPVNVVKFLKTPVLQHTSNGCLCISRVKSKFYEYGAATDYFTFSVLQCTSFLKNHRNCADTFHFDEVSLVFYLKGFNIT